MLGPGTLNLITDVSGLLVGHATAENAQTGVTVIRCERPMKAAVDLRGGGPGTRETDVLLPENLVDEIDALVLSGGSVFGLAAADSVAAALSHQGVGLSLSGRGPAIPIVPAAVLHDLGNGGQKDWAGTPPYHRLGTDALDAVAAEFGLGARGAGRGATAGTVTGGIGSTSIDVGEDIIIGALAVVNSMGSVFYPDGESFYAWPFELEHEFGNKTPPAKHDLGDPFPEFARLHETGRMQAGTNTTLAAVATTAALTGAELKRVAMMAHDGMARAIRPAHTPFDGDIVFALSNGAVTLPETTEGFDRASWVARIGSAAADCLARAIARGVYESTDATKRKSTR